MTGGAARRLRVDLAYDGGPYAGFARQPDRATVQGTLEGALSRVLGQDVSSTCAGRTDAGVHALAQVVHLDVEPTERAVRALQRLDDDAAAFRMQLDHQVGDAITIWQVAVVEDAFDARFSAEERRYRYVIHDAPAMDPRDRYVRWRMREPLDVAAMHAGAQHLLGEHDYASFCRLARGGHTRRSLRQCDVVRADSDTVHVVLRGPAFCHQLCRAITGCLVAVGRGAESPDWIREVLEARDRSVAAPVAPPQGLTLEGVGYPDPWPDAPARLGPIGAVAIA